MTQDKRFAEEKRAFSRVPFKTDAVVRFQNEVIAGEVENLSLAGAFIKTSAVVPLGEVVDIRIFLAGTSSELSLNVKGDVVRHDSQGMAVRFTEMDLDSFVHLRNIVAYNSTDIVLVEKEFEKFLRGRKRL